MIEIETVLVLGAGASKDFGFPTGQELVKQICERFSKDVAKDFLHICSGQVNLNMDYKFPDALKEADPISVDVWLERNPEVLEVGRAAIAIALLEYEQGSNLRPEKNWYQLLFQRLNSPFDDFQNNKLSIVTFNYDRSLEKYLFKAFRHTYAGKGVKECEEKLSHLKIIHVYGSLGRLEWQSNDPKNPTEQLPYATKPDIFTVQSAAKGIKIISEGIQELPWEFQEARRLIEQAKALYFLGFGYHENNIKRLGIDTLNKPSKIMGTSYGLDYQRIREIERLSIRDLLRNNGLVCKPVYEFLYNYVNFNELGLPDIVE